MSSSLSSTWDDRRSWDGAKGSVRFWLDELKGHSPDCKVIIVGNKTDLLTEGKRCITDEEVDRFCTKNGYPPCVRTSAKTGAGVHRALSLAIKAPLDWRRPVSTGTLGAQDRSESEVLDMDNIGRDVDSREVIRRQCCPGKHGST